MGETWLERAVLPKKECRPTGLPAGFVRVPASHFKGTQWLALKNPVKVSVCMCVCEDCEFRALDVLVPLASL